MSKHSKKFVSQVVVVGMVVLVVAVIFVNTSLATLACLKSTAIEMLKQLM